MSVRANPPHLLTVRWRYGVGVNDVLFKIPLFFNNVGIFGFKAVVAGDYHPA